MQSRGRQAEGRMIEGFGSNRCGEVLIQTEVLALLQEVRVHAASEQFFLSPVQAFVVNPLQVDISKIPDLH